MLRREGLTTVRDFGSGPGAGTAGALTSGMPYGLRRRVRALLDRGLRNLPRGSGRDWRDVPLSLRVGLGGAAGAAFSGMTTFWAIVLVPDHRGLVVAGAAAVTLGLCLLRSTRRPDGPAPFPEPNPEARVIIRWLGAAAFAAVWPYGWATFWTSE